MSMGSSESYVPSVGVAGFNSGSILSKNVVVIRSHHSCRCIVYYATCDLRCRMLLGHRLLIGKKVNIFLMIIMSEKFVRFSFPKSYPDAGGKVTSGAVGFMGPVGSKEHPSYREVCSGSTGHVEGMSPAL